MTSSTPRAAPVRTAAVDLEAAVLDAASRLLAAEGPVGLGIRRVASEAAVSPMSIYNRFGDKAGLLDALFGRGFGHLTKVVSTVGGAHALARVRASGWAYRSFALGDPGTYGLMFDRSGWGHEPSEQALKAAADAFSALVLLVTDAQDEGTIVGGAAPELAQRLWASLHGAVSLELRGICFAADAEAHYGALLDTLLAGLAPEAGIAGLA